ncbi:unnamed protein product [Gongylonema pulchrum]|uniref:ANF_receptor domain-containing protein n=1 Tax=Gongylonema pulchrum TaxID=637853 RepID=A0A183EI89_9BILA|nr:unnamed protein product [Gongylonema pulchrum]
MRTVMAAAVTAVRTSQVSVMIITRTDGDVDGDDCSNNDGYLRGAPFNYSIALNSAMKSSVQDENFY